MKEAVIVATARTPIGKAYRGAFNNTHGATLAGHAIRAALDRANIEPALIEDVIMGAGWPEGAVGNNIGRLAAIRAGLPVGVPGMTVNRLCSSGLNAIAIAANRIQLGEAVVQIAGGLESVSLVEKSRNRFRWEEDWLLEHKPEVYWSMIRTADNVAHRYGIRREAQDEYALESQRRTAVAQSAGLFEAEIVPLAATKNRVDKEGNIIGTEATLLVNDEGNRPNTTLEDLAKLKPVSGDSNFVTAGNASQLSDGASACVIAEAQWAEQQGLTPLGYFRGFDVVGCEPDEMGIGPIFAVPKLLRRFALKIDDIGLWEMNEAFAVQVLYCRDRLHIPPDRLNVNGGAISIGHPFGMTGARCVGHALLEGKRRRVKYVVVTMCIGGGAGAAALFEIA